MTNQKGFLSLLGLLLTLGIIFYVGYRLYTGKVNSTGSNLQQQKTILDNTKETLKSIEKARNEKEKQAEGLY